MEDGMSINEIERRLNFWSYYIYDLFKGNIGWPTQSVLLADANGPRYPTTGTCPILKYESCQQVDLWIRQMGSEYPLYEQVVYNYYLSKSPVNVIARRMGISRRTMEQRLHDAKLWLSGRLRGFEQISENM